MREILEIIIIFTFDPGASLLCHNCEEEVATSTVSFTCLKAALMKKWEQRAVRAFSGGALSVWTKWRPHTLRCDLKGVRRGEGKAFDTFLMFLVFFFLMWHKYCMCLAVTVLMCQFYTTKVLCCCTTTMHLTSYKRTIELSQHTEQNGEAEARCYRTLFSIAAPGSLQTTTTDNYIAKSCFQVAIDIT